LIGFDLSLNDFILKENLFYFKTDINMQQFFFYKFPFRNLEIHENVEKKKVRTLNSIFIFYY